MGEKIRGSNSAHDTALTVAESVRQSTDSGVAQSAAGQATARAADIAFARAAASSCITNNSGQGIEPFLSALRALGAGSL